MENFKDSFFSGAIEIPKTIEAEAQLFERHYQLLKKWNGSAGLVSKNTLSKAFAIHYVDSLYISEFAKRFSSGLVHDLGSGGGFPGIIHAIRSKDRVVLYEKDYRKKAFLELCTQELNLNKAIVEDAIPKSIEGGVVLARAVWPPEELLTKVGEMLSASSILVMSLGEKVPKSFQDFTILEKSTYVLPGEVGKRLLVAVSRGTKYSP